MDWLTALRVVIDCDCKRVTSYTSDSICVMFQGDKHDSLPQAVYDEARRELSLRRVVCEYENVFLDELPGLPPQRDVEFYIELHLGTSPISITSHGMAPVKL